MFSGDAVNAPAGVQTFKRCIARLAAIAPTFVVRGNWDVWYWKDLDLFSGTGARELTGGLQRVRVRGADVCVTGAAVEAPLFREPLPRDAFNVFVYHYPDEIEAAAAAGADLYCAGHTHGGQVALPFYGALVTLSKYDKRFESGLHRVGGMHLYVNRGLGMEGFLAPRVRFCARPELTVIDVVPSPQR